MTKQLVSIIIPTFNRASIIGETLKSVIEQTYINWECIVVDDGSNDTTDTVVSGYTEMDSRIKYHKRPVTKPKGANACRNFGLELCKGEFVCWLDSDDLLHRDKFLHQVEALRTSSCQFCVCQSLLFNNSPVDATKLRSENLLSENPIQDFFTKKIIIPIQAPLFRKSFILENNFTFDETLQAGQEWELFTRILFKENTYKLINQPLDYIRQHHGSISGSIEFKQKWNYFLARYKIHRNYKEHFTPVMSNYLRFFYLKTFKDFLRTKQYRSAYFIWKKCIIRDGVTTLKNHVFIAFSFVCFIAFNKGDVFLTKVK